MQTDDRIQVGNSRRRTRTILLAGAALAIVAIGALLFFRPGSQLGPVTVAPAFL